MYCKNIVDSYCGYLATPGYISYKSNEDIEEVMSILKYNDYQAEDADFLLDALVYGIAAELNDSCGKIQRFIQQYIFRLHLFALFLKNK